MAIIMKQMFKSCESPFITGALTLKRTTSKYFIMNQPKRFKLKIPLLRRNQWTEKDAIFRYNYVRSCIHIVCRYQNSLDSTIIQFWNIFFLQEGLCPDIDQSGNSQDQVEFRGGMKNTYTNTFDVDFRRSIIPNDNYDAPIPLSGATQVLLFIYIHVKDMIIYLCS